MEEFDEKLCEKLENNLSEIHCDSMNKELFDTEEEIKKRMEREGAPENGIIRETSQELNEVLYRYELLSKPDSEGKPEALEHENSQEATAPKDPETDADNDKILRHEPTNK